MYNGVFKEVSDENTAYWLGFLAADGCVKEDLHQLTLGLSRKDKNHIEKFKKFVGSDVNITDRDMLCSTNGKYYPSSIIYVLSKELIEDLSRYNIVPDKSHKNIDFLQYIPEQYKIYFILGYFDGDGYYIFTEKSQGFGWCGCKDNVNAIANYVKQYFCLTTNARCYSYQKSPITYAFTDTKLSDIRIFCEFYLSNATTIDLLERKVDKAKRLLEFTIDKMKTLPIVKPNNQPRKRQKKRSKKITICPVCKKEFHAFDGNVGKYCSQKCAHIAQQKVNRPSREELKQLIRTTSFLQIGKQFDVSDNTIRKWCKSMDLPNKSQDIKQYSDQEWELI